MLSLFSGKYPFDDLTDAILTTYQFINWRYKNATTGLFINIYKYLVLCDL
jgi:hypothetical protein